MLVILSGMPAADVSGRRYRGKTSGERRAERRRRLIDAGLELFGTIGYSDTTVRGVLRESGLGERYFAESFDSLEDLLLAVHDRIHSEVAADVLRAVEHAGDDPQAQAEAGLRALIDGLTADPRRARVKLVEVVGAGPRVEARRRELTLQVADFLAARIDPEVHPADARALALASYGAASELLLAWHLGEVALTSDQVVRHLVAMFSGALARGAAQ
jgi:AcrR family transcriptional regulator